MAELMNVGNSDRVIRIVLGALCAVMVAYHFLATSFLPLYALILVIILVPFFLKTGITRSCPIMKAMGVSTMKKDAQA
jgi:hypothetical protein